MNPVLSEIYSTVLGGAPYVIAAYALIFAILMVYVIMTTMKLKNTESALAWFLRICDLSGGCYGRLPLFLSRRQGCAWRWGARCSFAAVLVRAGVQPFWAFPARRSSVVQYTHAIERAAVRGASFSQIGDVR